MASDGNIAEASYVKLRKRWMVCGFVFVEEYKTNIEFDFRRVARIIQISVNAISASASLC